MYLKKSGRYIYRKKVSKGLYLERTYAYTVSVIAVRGIIIIYGKSQPFKYNGYRVYGADSGCQIANEVTNQEYLMR